MYMILRWLEDNNFLTCVSNPDGGIRLFGTLEEADLYANMSGHSDDMRVISIQAVEA
jgi:hypothetical protein